jgi:hypothetical protein
MSKSSGDTSGHLLESGEVGKIGMEHMKKLREQTVKKWEDAGFLEGLNGHVKDNIAQLYESQASSLLNESTIENKSEGFENVVFPIIRQVYSKMMPPPSGDTSENKTENGDN